MERGARSGLALIASACLLSLLASATFGWVVGSSSPGAEDGGGVALLIWEAVFLAAGIAAMWRGIEGGRWLAVAVLLVMSVQNLFLSVLELDSPSMAMWGGSAAVVCLAAALALWFTERVGDFLYRRLPREASADWDGVMQEVAGAQALRASPDPQLRPPPSAEALLARARRRRLWGRLSLLALGAVLLYFLVGLASTVFSIVAMEVDSRRQLDAAATETVGSVGSVGEFIAALFVLLSLALASVLLPILGVVLLAYGYFAFFVAPFLFTSPLTAPLALSWRPARFLLLRPFHRRKLTSGLVRFLRRHVVGFGHTYTLADTTLKVPWYVRFPALLGQVSLASFRFRKIRHPAHVHRACRAIRRTRLRNLNWLVSLDKIFTLACSDPAWRAVVSRLLGEVDLVFIDVTGVRENVVWEVEQCIRMGKLERVIFLVDEREREAAERALHDILGRPAARELLCYNTADRRGAAAAAAVIARALAENGGPGAFPRPALPPPWRDALRLRMLRRALIALAAILALALLARYA